MGIVTTALIDNALVIELIMVVFVLVCRIILKRNKFQVTSDVIIEETKQVCDITTLTCTDDSFIKVKRTKDQLPSTMTDEPDYRSTEHLAWIDEQ